MADSGRLRKLHWLCRRGMKELDILLERFLDGHENALARGDWPEFESLLGLEDDVLWDWIQDSTLADGAQRELIEAIREPHA